MKKVYFHFEEINGNKTINTKDNVLQVGFLNYSVAPVSINGFRLPPAPEVGVEGAKINLYIMWMPVLNGERDATQYKISFVPNANRKKLIVWYKTTEEIF